MTRKGASHASTSSFGEARQVDRCAVEADGSPRIGDVVLDPFEAHRRGDVRLAERDFRVSVAPRQPVVDQTKAEQEYARYRALLDAQPRTIDDELEKVTKQLKQPAPLRGKKGKNA